LERSFCYLGGKQKPTARQNGGNPPCSMADGRPSLRLRYGSSATWQPLHNMKAEDGLRQIVSACQPGGRRGGGQPCPRRFRTFGHGTEPDVAARQAGRIVGVFARVGHQAAGLWRHQSGSVIEHQQISGKTCAPNASSRAKVPSARARAKTFWPDRDDHSVPCARWPVARSASA
jgi:hypothetical protein